jgi:hypothetical protein
MSVDKFKFVSPGVFIDEIDQSGLPQLPGPVGPVIIGRSLRGPVMRPVMVDSFAQFAEVFGEPVPGGVGGDVWRDGNKTAPTYGAYAAQAYLKNSSPVTFIRLAGYSSDDSAIKAGWKMNTAYGLYCVPIVSASENVWNVTSNATGALTAVIYSNDTTPPKITGKHLSGSDEVSLSDTILRQTAVGGETKLVLEGKTYTVNFDENSKKYIRNVLNTNPTQTNENILNPNLKYFLGETFITNETTASVFDAAGNYGLVLVRLASGSMDFANRQEVAQYAETGWVVSQHKGLPSEFVAVDGEYPVQKLFRVLGLTEGEWNSDHLKVSIEDIKESGNKFNQFGSFTVAVRRIEDTDTNPIYLERFTGCNLDPSSENFVAKKIGDKYTAWDYNSKQWIEYGTYNNKSKFIRVEVDAQVAAAQTAADLLPYGYYGPKKFKPYPLTMNSGSHNISATFTTSSIKAQITSSGAITASLGMPVVPTYVNSADSLVTSLSSLYWGVKTNIGSSKRFNKAVVDLTNRLPPSTSNASTEYSYFFTLDNVSASLTDSKAVDVKKSAAYATTNRSSSLSVTSQFSTGSDGSSALLSVFNKFTMPLYGGTDGLNITEKDPFNKRILAAKANYAYDSVKTAIESVADPEVVEMNVATIPGVEEASLTTLLIEKCEQRGDALAIIDLEGDYTPDEGKSSAGQTDISRKSNVDNALRLLKERSLNSSYGCAYFPWVLIKDALNGNTVWVPPSVAAIGTFSSSQRRTELWFAPAGFNRGGLSDGAAGLPVLQTALRISSKDRDKLYEANINPIATFPAEGVVIFGQKTLQVTPSALDRINVRRLMIYVKKEISRFATRVLFDPNTKVTWARFTNLAVPFLDSVKSRFGLDDFKVVLDETTTTADLIDRNIMYAKIFLKPTRAIEYIALDFTITNTGAAFQD